MNELARQDGAERHAERDRSILRGFGGELSRRLKLAREPAPAGAGGPALRRLFGELSILRDSFRREEFVPPQAIRPRPVMLLPGFCTHPGRMNLLSKHLRAAGHCPHQWGLGFNLGPTPDNFRFLRQRLRDLHRRHGEPISLVGWSLGGLFARELARSEPEATAMVITMGSPFSGDPRANNAWRLYQLIAGHRVEEPPVGRDVAIKPPVPTIALWSPRDGIVSPRSACGKPGERDRAVGVRCSHLGFAYEAEAASAVLRELDRN